MDAAEHTTTSMPEQSTIWRSPSLRIAVLTMLYVLVMANWLLEVVRFSSARANAGALFLAQALPLIALGIGIRSLTGRRRWMVVAGVGPMVVTAALCTALLGLGWAFGLVGNEAAFERMSVLETPKGTVAVYRTNGGATTSYGIVLRHEAQLAPGVLLVRRLDHIYPASSARLSALDDDTVQVALDERDGILSAPVRRTYHLRWLVVV